MRPKYLPITLCISWHELFNSPAGIMQVRGRNATRVLAHGNEYVVVLHHGEAFLFEGGGGGWVHSFFYLTRIAYKMGKLMIGNKTSSLKTPLETPWKSSGPS